MPIARFERDVLGLLARNRNPDSYVAGATVLLQAEGSPRTSRDIDVFHDTAESVARSAQLDAAALHAAGYGIEWQLVQPTFQRALVSRGAERTVLEWVFDSAFRFFPVEPDPDLGYRLGFWDAATNKVLALASRNEPRDLIDVLFLDARHLGLGALSWAAAGKDAGLSPSFILEQTRRTTHYAQAQFDALALVEPVDARELKRRWLACLERADRLVAALPAAEVGCLYLDTGGKPITPDPADPGFARLVRHVGSVRGSWPTIG